KIERKTKSAKKAEPKQNASAEISNPVQSTSSEQTALETKISKRLQLAQLDLNATASEIRCYVDRFTEIVAMMQEAEDDIVQSNTLYAIMSGAIAAILDGSTVYDTAGNQKIILAGGLLVSYFSYRAFRPDVTVEFKPKSSNLKDLWFNVESSPNFSTSLWFLLTKPMLGEEQTIRDLLIQRWKDNGFLGADDTEERKHYENLFFGAGGVSSLTVIKNRKEMNNQLQTLIQLLEQDVKVLQIELLRLQSD
ncbi:MAG TPA: hypothetical protein PK453_14370, partial [Leptospiraceae bacterium]|nr:hypothetical protein [Leptospiraceae bacterium]HNF14850.1 hypothetical protein [Leptospiraceae bacterium]HNN04410.1 hypothetical protein [Leptospiraceae bacterium]